MAVSWSVQAGLDVIHVQQRVKSTDFVRPDEALQRLSSTTYRTYYDDSSYDLRRDKTTTTTIVQVILLGDLVTFTALRLLLTATRAFTKAWPG